MGLPKKIKALIPFYGYRVAWSEEDKAFVVSVDELPGCVTHADQPDRALERGYEAVELYLETLLDDMSVDELPLPRSKEKHAGKFLLRASSEEMSKIVARAKASPFRSTNKFVLEAVKFAMNNPAFIASPAPRKAQAAKRSTKKMA